MFFWDCIINPPIGNVITFTANATGLIGASPITSNNAIDSITVRDFTSGGEGEELVLKDELFGKPGVFLIFPNFVSGANSDGLGFWSVNVANPTLNPISVNKVLIAAVSPRATSSDKLFKDACHTGGGVKPVAVPPTTNVWTCPESNQLMWRDYNNPQVIPPRSVFPFQVMAPTFGGTSNDTANWLVQPVVYTTLGQFGKAGYATSMHTKESAIPNVYLSRTTDSILPANIIGNVSKIDAQSVVTFNATLAEMNTFSPEQINAGSRLIINVPKDWGLPAILSATGYDVTTVTQFPDGSSQIVGNLTAALDGAAKTIQFTSLAPNVNSTKMYVMHMLADGFATGDGGIPQGYSIGPIAESIVQVCPTTSPPPECL